MEGDDLLVCRKCGGLLMVDGLAKVKHDIAATLGLDVVNPVCTYSCGSCGVSFTEHESGGPEIYVPKWGDDEDDEYGSNLTELNFDR